MLKISKKLNILQSKNRDDKATFLDLAIQIHNLHCTIKIYHKRHYFDFEIVKYPCLGGDVPSSPSCGTYLSQLDLLEYAPKSKI